MTTAPLAATDAARLEVNCRVCNSPHFSPYLEGRGYRIVKCLDCGLRYLNPQPGEAELWNFYADFDSHSTWRGDGEERFDRAMSRIVLQH